MSKPPNWSFLDHLMREYYPKEYQRILSEQQTRMDLSSLDPPKKGAKRRAAGSHRHDPEQRADDHRRRSG